MLSGWVTASAADGLLLALSAVACALCISVPGVAGSPQRRSWLMLAIGLAGWVVGFALRVVYPAVTGSALPFPSFADAGFLLLPLTVSLGWAARMSPRTRPGRRPFLDAVIVAGAVFLVFWVLAFRGLLAGSHGTVQLVVALAYPIGDIAMITVAVMFLATATRGYRSSTVLMATAFMLVAVTDGLTVSERIHGAPESAVSGLGRAFGLIMIAAAALVTRRHARSGDAAELRTDRIRAWLPYVPLPVAAGVGLAQLWYTSATRPILVGAAVLGVGALVRQLLTLADNRCLVEQLSAQTRRDPLTGLANRLLFDERLDDAMKSRRPQQDITVLVLGLHDFALVNDNLGRAAGDTLLRSIANRLTETAPDGATVARFEGGQFTILIPAASGTPEHLAQLAIAVFDKPFLCDGEELFMHASVGAATVRPLDADDANGNELIRRAEIAMHRARRSGLGGIQTWAPDPRGFDTGPAAASSSRPIRSPGSPPSDIQILGQLRRVVDNRGLTLVYQPKVALNSGATVGVEALVRWPHPDLGVLLPDQFLPLVGRHSGLMAAVTDVVLHQAIGAAAEWHSAGLSDLSVAVNLFAPSLADATLPDRIAQVLAMHQLPARLLTVEITEHFLLSNLERARAVVRDLRNIGLRISIDDFGSGYATMSYLQDLPINELKLDRQFIAPVLSNPRSAAIVQSILGLTRVLGITSVAEGVEDAAIADWLRAHNCDIAQGYYFGKPMPANDIRTFVTH